MVQDIHKLTSDHARKGKVWVFSTPIGSCKVCPTPPQNLKNTTTITELDYFKFRVYQGEFLNLHPPCFSAPGDLI